MVISNIGTSNDGTALLCNANDIPTDSATTSGGDWFAPDNTHVDGTDVPGFSRTRGPGLVQLIRNSAATGTPTEGIYSCIVQDDTLILQTVYVGLYNSGGGGWFSHY